ncbi:MAG: PilZ domain-containing protein [Acidobacteria bacterium]|nr:MAG: PilZ domain-containing protein [Acidobacteriota bacterium]
MRTDSSNNAASVPMSKERRQRARFKIDCPVTVLTPGRGKKRLIGCGSLYDISEKGARFFLDGSLEAGHRVSLEVDFRHPDGGVTTIRFRSLVLRVLPGESYEVAVSFLKGESYVRGKGSRWKGEASPWNLVTKGNYWIN